MNFDPTVRSTAEVTVGDYRCPECRIPTRIVENQREGIVVCTSCGLVIESHMILDSAEWHDPSNNRLGGFEADGISLQTRDSEHYNQKVLADRQLETANALIRKCVNDLKEPEAVYQRATHLFLKIHEEQPSIRKSDAFIAACLYWACKWEARGLLVKQLQSKLGIKSNIGRQIKVIRQMNCFMLEHRKAKTKNSFDTTVDRYCSLLNLSMAQTNKVQELLKEFTENHSCGAHTSSIAGAIILYIGGDTRKLKDIATVVGKSPTTLKSVYTTVMQFVNKRSKS